LVPERELPARPSTTSARTLALRAGLDGAFAQVWLGLDDDDFVDGRR